MPSIVSIDFIRGIDKQLWLCEVNGCPFGLRNTYRLPNFLLDKRYAHLNSPLQCLAETLAGDACGGRVALPFSPISDAQFPEEGGGSLKHQLDCFLIAGEPEVVAERQELSVLVEHFGASTELCSAQHLKNIGGQIRFADNNKIDLIYGNYLLNAVDYGEQSIPVYTDTKTRNTCRDKLYVAHSMLRGEFSKYVIPTARLDDEFKVGQVFEIAQANSGYIVIKPRHGFGGIGVMRFTCTEMTGHLHDMERFLSDECGSSQELDKWVIQPWIDSATAADTGLKYCESLHLYLLGDSLFAGHVTQAAAPSNYGSSNKLSWLSGLGIRRAIIRSDFSAQADIAELRRICSQIMLLLSE